MRIVIVLIALVSLGSVYYLKSRPESRIVLITDVPHGYAPPRTVAPTTWEDAIPVAEATTPASSALKKGATKLAVVELPKNSLKKISHRTGGKRGSKRRQRSRRTSHLERLAQR